jgi:mono/diheme cytochrome c family protein
MTARSFGFAAAALLAAAPLIPAAGPAPPPHDPVLASAGAPVFREHCATCHGAAARGDGPLAEKLQFAPPDLTGMHRRTRGGFSFAETRRIIDGRKPLPGHGGPEMPVWGDALRTRDEGYSEKRAAEKINGLVHYLASIQKP